MIKFNKRDNDAYLFSIFNYNNLIAQSNREKILFYFI